jgi:prepilin-type N-terminal cleavage/methylation domain-containing protein
MRQRGFTLVEVLVALGIMAVGLVGVLALEKGSVSASGYSRRATEAAVLGEDKLEKLRTVLITTVVTDHDQVDANGVVNNTSGTFVRTWTVTPVDASTTKIEVDVTWNENDGDHTLVFTTLRNLN